MPDNPYVEARQALPTAALTLPPDFLDGNAAALLQIIDELKRSLLVEFKMIRLVTHSRLTDVSDETRKEVQGALNTLEEYIDSRFYDDERTHCHNIDRVAVSIVEPLSLPVAGGATLKEDFQALLEPLREADNEYLDELEPLANEALIAMRAINGHVQATENDPSRLADAREVIAEFTRQVADRKDKARALLSKMNDAANSLFDRLIKGF